MKGFLRYGDSVVFYASEKTKRVNLKYSKEIPVESKIISGFLSAKGFLNSDVSFQTIAKPLLETNYQVVDFANLRDCVFKITPRLKYECNKAYKKAFAELKKINQGFNNLSKEDRDKKQPILQSYQRKVMKAKERAEQEKKVNLEIINSAQGSQVLYDNDVQLMHRDSEGFLVARDKCSKTEQIGNSLEIGYQFTNRMVFKCQPRYKTRQSGDPVQYTDKIWLKNVKKLKNISISHSNFEVNDESLMNNPFLPDITLKEPRSTSYQVYLGEKGIETWEVLLFSNRQINDNDGSLSSLTRPIEGSDLIRIKHAEFDSFLASSLHFESSKNMKVQSGEEIYFRSYKGSYSEEFTGVETVWEISHDCCINQGAPFKLPDNKITLSHFNSGRFIHSQNHRLSLQSLHNDSSEAESEQIMDHTVFSFLSMQLGVKTILAGKCYKISSRDDLNQGFVSPSQERLSRDSIITNPATLKLIDEYMFAPLEESFFEEEKVRAILSTQERSLDSFQVILVPENEKKDLLFLRSIIGKFHELQKLLQTNQKMNLNNQLLVDIETILKHIICFLHDVKYNPNEPYEVTIDGIEPLDSKQKSFKDLGFIEILVDFVHLPFANNFFSLKDVHKKLFVPNVLNLSYNCIRSGIMEYRPNELYASQWLDLMIHYFLSELDSSIKAKETLTELIDNNHKILETRIKRSTIDEFVKNLIELGGDKRYTEILRAMCICDGKPMLKNQNAITEAILLDEDVREKLILQLTFDQKQEILIASPWLDNEDDQLALKELAQKSEIRDSGRYYSFYCSMIYLLGDLCQDRNYTAIQTLRSYFSVPICISIITTKDYSFSLRSAFCRLMESLWINVFPFMELKIPSNIKNWAEESSSLVMKGAAPKSVVGDYEKLTNFIFAYLGSDNNNTLKDWQKNGPFVIELVQMLLKMLTVGFFSDFEVFQNLQNHLQKILNETDDIVENMSNVKSIDNDYSVKEPEEQQIPEEILEIKLRVLQLFRVKKEVQSDLRLNKLIDHFKSNISKTYIETRMTDQEKAQVHIQEAEPMQKKFMEGFQELILPKNEDEGFQSFMKKDKSFIRLLMKQSVYNNKNLKKCSITLLNDLFSESNYLQSRISQLQIIESHSLRHLEGQEEINRYLFRLAETIEVWSNDPSSKKFVELKLLLKRLLANMNEIEMEEMEMETQDPDLMNLLKQNPFLNDSLISEFDNLSSFSQDLLRNTGCLESALEILKASIYIEDKSAEKFEEIPQMIYFLLSKASSKNRLNQKYLTNFLENSFIPHFKVRNLRSRICAFLNKLAQNNMDILVNKNKNSILVDSLFSIIKQEKDSLYIKAYALYTSQLTIFKDRVPIKANQNLIISKIISSDLQEAFKDQNPHLLYETLKKDLLVPTSEFNCGNLSVSLLPENVCLDLAYLEIISCCSYNKNLFAENISHSLITCEVIEQILAIKRRHPLLDYELFKMIYHVYICSKSRYSTQIELFLMNVMLHINTLLASILDNIIKGYRTLHFLTHKELVSNEHVFMDTINILLRSVEIFIGNVLKDEYSKVDMNTMKEFVTTFITSNRKVLKRLKFVRLQRKILQSLELLDLSLSKNNFGTNSLSNFSKGQMYGNQTTLDSGRNNHKTSTVHTTVHGKDHPNLRMNDDGFTQDIEIDREQLMIFREYKIYQDNFRQSYSFNMAGDGFKVVANGYFQNKESSKFEDREIKYLIEISTQNNSQLFSDFLDSLISFLDPTYNNDEAFVRIGLKIFREYLNYCEKEWGSSSSKMLIGKQNHEQIHLRIIELICKIIPQAHTSDLFCDCLEVANRLLSGGDEKSQLQFLKVFNDRGGGEVISSILNRVVESLNLFLKKVASKNTECIRKVLIGEFEVTEQDQIDSGGLQSDLKVEDSYPEKVLLIKSFEFMQNLCEGHNLKLQEYLRLHVSKSKPSPEMSLQNQADGGSSENENVISLSTHFFGYLVKTFNADCVDIINIVLDFMVEAVQGPCRGNQQEMIECNVLTFCRDFLNELNSSKADLLVKGLNLDETKDNATVNNLFSKTIKFLMALLELNNNSETLFNIANSVRFVYLLKKLVSVYENYVNSHGIDSTKPKKVTNKLMSRTFEKELREGFEIFGFIQTINDGCSVYKKEINSLRGNELDAFTFFKLNTGEIELVFGGELQRVYFMVHPACNYLIEKYKRDLMRKVRRDNSNQKLSDFLEEKDRYFDLMDHTFNLEKKYKIRLSYLQTVRDCALLVATMINFYIFSFFQLRAVKSIPENDTREFYPFILNFLGISHLTLSIFMIVLQLLIRTRLILTDKWRIAFKKFRKQLLLDENVNGVKEQKVLEYLNKDMRRVSYSEYLQILAMKRQKTTEISEQHSVPILYFVAYGINYFLSDFEIIYFVFYSVCSMVALIGNFYVLYPLFLFEIIFRFEDMRNVIRSVTSKWEQLLLTGILGMVIAFIYTLFGYYFLIDSFWNDDFGENGENQCTSVFHCFLTIVSLGPRSSGGLGDMLVRESYQDDNLLKFSVRYIYDVSCFIIINLIWLNINFGLIIDTFAMLRDSKNKMENDQANVCFVCSLDRQKFDKTASGFDTHIKKEHNIWNYLYYLYYLKQKEKTEYSGVESFVSKMVLTDNLFWFPVGKAIILQDLKDKDQEPEETVRDIYEIMRRSLHKCRELIVKHEQTAMIK